MRGKHTFVAWRYPAAKEWRSPINGDSLKNKTLWGIK
ncbi:MAG: hypothetical protein ACJAXR_000941 [Halopseudomonas sp.]|jgi:hypothetical protein